MKAGYMQAHRAALSSVLLFTLALVTAPSAAAQTAQKFSLQVSGLGQAFYGDFGNINSGYGVEGQLRYNHSAFSIGAGAQFTRHGTDSEGLETVTIDLVGVFLEPRYVMDMGSDKAAPYFSGRFSVSDMNFTEETLGRFATESGITLNAGGGFLYRMGMRTNLDVGATFGYQRLGVIGETTVGTVTGTNLVLRVGLAYGLGG